MGDDHGNGIMFMAGFGVGVVFVLVIIWLANHVTITW